MVKRIFDIIFSITGLLITGWLIAFFYIAASIDTTQNGMFVQIRIGRYGRQFRIFKLRTMTFTPGGQKNISALGAFLRKSKIDELPQLYNILIGDMSFVGPRPDIPGYYDTLTGTDRKLLDLRPGLTGPANLKYWNEEALLQAHPEPDLYNDTVLFPDKVKINLKYRDEQTFWLDLKIIFFTFFKRSHYNKVSDTY